MAEYDLVLKKGTLYDGTGGAPMRADLAVRGTRIAAIGPDLDGPEVIDCEGLCVAPGFIDTHSHSDLAALAEPSLEMKVRQGVTLELLGHDGLSVAPLRAGDVEGRRRQVAPLLGQPELDWSWRSVANYLDALDLSRPALDTAYLVPHGAIRESIIGPTDSPAEPHDVFRMKGLLARSLDEGAFGVSTSLSGRPGRLARHEELTELAGVAASRQVPLVLHLRSDGDRVLESVEEAARIARESGVHVHLARLKIAGRRNWERLEALLEAIQTAQREAIKITADLYPYEAGVCPLAAMLPPWVLEGGTDAALERLASENDRARVRAWLLEADVGRDDPWHLAGPEAIHLSLPSGRRPELAGRPLAELGRDLGRDPIDLALDLLREERLEVFALPFDQSEEVIERLLRLPFVNVCSASSPVRPHPRSWGAFPRVLARFVRERSALSLEAAVRKMSGLPADVFGLSDHGYLLEGKRANLVVFDPAQVRDTATFEQPASGPEGIPHVLVAGRPVVRDGRLTGERPGRVARRRRA
jgi:N-acyl-D-amino-acid deacylase